MGRMNRIIISILCVVFCFLVIGAFISPYDKPDERTKCRKEIARIRDFLRNSNAHMELGFIDWQTNICNQSKSTLGIEMSKYCWEICKRENTPVLNFQIRHGVHYLVDPWGQDYNIADTNNLPFLKQCKNVKDWNVGPFIIWSSGPNKKNENGAGDDIVGMRK